MCEEGLVSRRVGRRLRGGRDAGWGKVGAEQPEAELWMQHVYNKKKGGADVISLVKPSSTPEGDALLFCKC